MENTNQTPVMTVWNILKVIIAYKKEFILNNILPIEYNDQGLTTINKKPNPIEIAQHGHWMAIQIEENIKKGEFDIGRLNRWLGFIQGCLFSIGSYSIYEMRDHNRPTDDRYTSIHTAYVTLKASLIDVDGINSVGISSENDEPCLRININPEFNFMGKLKLSSGGYHGFNVVIKEKT